MYEESVRLDGRTSTPGCSTRLSSRGGSGSRIRGDASFHAVRRISNSTPDSPAVVRI